MSEKNVLIVDDEKEVRESISDILSNIGYNVKETSMGEEAIKIFREEKETLEFVFLDLNMPDMDGIEVLKELKEIKPDEHIVMISSHATIESAVKVMELGAVDYLEKPVNEDSVREVIRKIQERRKISKDEAEDYSSFVELAKRYIGEQKFDLARDMVKKAISIDPSMPQAFNLLGGLTEIKGDEDQAMKYYRASLSLDPTYDPANVNLTRVSGGPSDEKGIVLDKEE